MSKRTCYHCLYAKGPSPARRMRERSGGGWPTMLRCINHPDCPGEFWDILPAGSCRNFRARREPAVRTTPPEPPHDKVRYIPLTKRKYAIVDAADYEWLNRFRQLFRGGILLPSGRGKSYNTLGGRRTNKGDERTQISLLSGGRLGRHAGGLFRRAGAFR